MELNKPYTDESPEYKRTNWPVSKDTQIDIEGLKKIIPEKYFNKINTTGNNIVKFFNDNNTLKMLFRIRDEFPGLDEWFVKERIKFNNDPLVYQHTKKLFKYKTAYPERDIILQRYLKKLQEEQNAEKK